MAPRTAEQRAGVAPRHVRADIQALRGLAITLVLLHHARVPFLSGGFLGVDIFFVISGFLMTGLIDEGLDAPGFKLSSFYARRVRRLFPAAYATLVVTALASILLVDSFEYRNLVGQLGGAFTFVVNIVLWRQSDYFGSEAALKPLLHMWSLSVEEQFYLVLPVLMLMTRVRYRSAIAGSIALASGMLCAYMLQRSPSATFYFLPTRAWELATGATTALLVRRGFAPSAIRKIWRPICASALIIVPFAADERGHPGLAAAMVCLATAVLMIPAAEPRRGMMLSTFMAIGDRSYSLYLVHWPVFALASNVFLTPVPAGMNVLLLGACALWMELQYRFVEQRFRSFPITRTSLATIVLIPILVLTISCLWARRVTTPDTIARIGNQGLSAACDFRGDFIATAACQSGPNPHTLVWGDSYAMHLVNGIDATIPDGLVQATRTVCGPFLGIAPVDGALYSRSWAERCIHFNESVVAYLSVHREIVTVVLSSALTQYVPGGEHREWRMLRYQDGGFEEIPQTMDLLISSVSHTATTLRAMGKRVVLFAPPPSLNFNIGRCLDRSGGGLPTVTKHPNCTFSLVEYQRYRSPILSFLADVEARTAVPVISFDSFLCGTGTCQTRLNGTMLYADSGHLSRSGSTLLSRKMGWSALVTLRAR